MSIYKDDLKPDLENYLHQMNDEQDMIFEKITKLVEYDNYLHTELIKIVFEWGILFGREGR